MKITRLKDNKIKIYGAEVEVFIGNSSIDSEEQYSIGFSSKSKGAINTPGDYEYGEFEVLALETKKTRNNTADIFKVQYEKVNVLFQYGDAELVEKSIVDQVGEVDILVLDGEASLVGSDILVQRFNPSVVVAINYDKDKLENLLGMDVSSTQNILSYKDSDFKDEEAVSVLIGLE